MNRLQSTALARDASTSSRQEQRAIGQAFAAQWKAKPRPVFGHMPFGHPTCAEWSEA